MPARYLLRFDDFCPTMNWPVWRQVETTLLDTGIKPILAVIPRNEDPELDIQPPVDGFWDEVRTWQARRWTIGLHGFRHRYDSCDAGLIGKNQYSEFAGHPEPIQEQRVVAAVKIFRAQGVEPDLWIAPAHSFDQITLRVLRRYGLSTVSDGLTLYPGLDREGTFWIPQQISEFSRRPSGIWTVCLHPNWWTQEQLLSFRADLQRYRSQITNVAEVSDEFASRRLNWEDKLTDVYLRVRRKGGVLARLALPRPCGAIGKATL